MNNNHFIKAREVINAGISGTEEPTEIMHILDCIKSEVFAEAWKVYQQYKDIEGIEEFWDRITGNTGRQLGQLTPAKVLKLEYDCDNCKHRPKLITHKCTVCGKEFEAKRVDAKYCGKTCAKRDERRKKKEAE
jgi:hypothetical protein